MTMISQSDLLNLIATKQVKHIAWKHNYGDNEETYDSVLWINRQPTNNFISGLSACCHFAYVDGEERYICDTVKEAKKFILEEQATAIRRMITVRQSPMEPTAATR